MKTFVVLFVSSGTFGVAIAIAYFFIAHEEATGTALLGIMAAALFFTAGYAVVAERNANLESDDPQGSSEDIAGTSLGVFATNSAYPILIALASAGVLVGLLYSQLLAGLCFLGFVICVWRMGAESART